MKHARFDTTGTQLIYCITNIHIDNSDCTEEIWENDSQTDI